MRWIIYLGALNPSGSSFQKLKKTQIDLAIAMGKRKLEMKKREKKQELNVTFSKRKKGLFHKAGFLSSLSSNSIQIAIIVFSPGNKPFTFFCNSSSIDAVLDRYVNFVKPNCSASSIPNSMDQKTQYLPLDLLLPPVLATQGSSERPSFKKVGFSTRKTTLMKKAQELSVLCGVDTLLICFDNHDPSSPLLSWPEDPHTCLSLIAKYHQQGKQKTRNPIGKRSRQVQDMVTSPSPSTTCSAQHAQGLPVPVPSSSSSSSGVVALPSQIDLNEILDYDPGEFPFLHHLPDLHSDAYTSFLVYEEWSAYIDALEAPRPTYLVEEEHTATDTIIIDLSDDEDNDHHQSSTGRQIPDPSSSSPLWSSLPPLLDIDQALDDDNGTGDSHSLLGSYSSCIIDSFPEPEDLLASIAAVDAPSADSIIFDDSTYDEDNMMFTLLHGDRFPPSISYC